MPKYEVGFEMEMAGVVEIEAESVEDAWEKVLMYRMRDLHKVDVTYEAVNGNSIQVIEMEDN